MLRITLLVVYLTHLFISGQFQTKAGSGLDPLGHPLGLSAPPPASLDTGGGVDPNGRP